MIRFAAAVITLAVLMGSFAYAQDSPPRVQVFGGFSLLRTDKAGLQASTMDVVLGQPANTFGLRTTFNSWSAEAQYNVGRWLGLAADVGSDSGGPVTASGGSKISGLPNGNSYYVLVGPVISYRTKSKVTPFAHALFGIDRAILKAGVLSGPSSTVSYNSENYNDIAFALGLGVDYKVLPHVALRLGQLDLFHTSVNFNKFYGPAFNSDQFEGLKTGQRNLRFSAGAVLQF